MTIVRDRWGIPHCWGESVEELAHAQGLAVAEDRAWQLEVERWRSEGTVAARLGPEHLAWDRFARRARLDDTARRAFERLGEEDRRFVSSFVDGVNEGLATTTEFEHYECDPGTWHPWTPLGVFAAAHILFGTFPGKLWRAHVAATVGERVAGLFSIEGSAGSNAWVEPYRIAGDPHRIIELPGVYYQVRLACPEFDVVGLGFPGVPGLPHFGHTGRVAWGITNAMADYQDVYTEELRRDGDALLVRDGDGWVPATVHLEQIEVRGAVPVPVEVVETPRGPLVDEGLSLRVPSRVEADLGFAALLPLLRARTVGDVVTALGAWVEPVNSALVADDTGAMRRLAAGRVPVRDQAAHRTPVPGWDPRFDWTGYAPMPVEVVTGTAVTANDRRPDVAALGFDFAPPFRAQRIAELQGQGAAPETIHLDVAAPRSALFDLLDVESTVDDHVAQVVKALREWDGRMAADSPAAGAFAAWRAAFVRLLAEHPALARLHSPARVDPVFAPWTDPLARIGLVVEGLIRGLDVDLAPLARAALSAVELGEPWGRRHRLTPVHVSTDPATLAAVTRLRVELGGDANCVLATATIPGLADECWRGPVMRYVWDLRDRADSHWVVPFGASGRTGSPHFDDQLPLWTNGELIPIETDWRRLGIRGERVYVEGPLALTRLDPAEHAGLVHEWVTRRGNGFWGMSGYSVDEVRDVYTYLDGLRTHHPYLLRLDGSPIGILQTYQPEHDPVGERYPVRPGDVGLHLLVAPDRGQARGLVDRLIPFAGRFLFADPSARRVVVDSEVPKGFALRRMLATGFTLDEEIDLTGKRTRLAFLTRKRFAAAYPLSRPGSA